MKPKDRREDIWQENFLSCKNHTDRRCQRSRYVRRRERLCTWCANRTAHHRVGIVAYHDRMMREGELSELRPNEKM